MNDIALSDIKTVWKPVKPWVEPVVAEICTTRRIYFVWGKSSGTSGEHPLGRALDFSVLEYGNGVPNPGPARPALGDEISTYLWRHRARLNVWYIIWSRRIISTNPNSYAYNRWTTYRGSNPHTDHVHVSFEASGTYTPPEDDMPISDADARKIAGAVWAHRLNPGPFAERIGGYPSDATYNAGGLLVGADAYGREDHRMWPRVLRALADLAQPMSDEERSALALRLAEQARELTEATDSVEAGDDGGSDER